MQIALLDDFASEKDFMTRYQPHLRERYSHLTGCFCVSVMI